VLHAYGPVSVRDIKQRAAERRRFINESPSRRALLAAVAALTAHDPGAVFSNAQVHAALAVAGHHWSRGTVRDLFEDEASSPAGRLLRVRRGHFRLRGEIHRARRVTTPTLAPVRDHVLDALRELAAEGRKRVTRAEVEQRLAASEMRYSQRAVRHGLQQLRQATPAVVALGPDQSYRLITG
jgi:hypothetical protein